MVIESEKRALPRQRKNDPAGLRARILDAAFDLFQSKGYQATSVQDVAARAGVTSGALHHHFPWKKSIGLAVIEERVARALEETWIKPVEMSADARSAILEIFADLAAELDEQGSVRGCPVNNLTLELAFSDADFRNALAQLFDRWRGAIRKKLGAGDEAKEKAELVVACYSGAMALAKVEQRGEPLRLCATGLADLL